MMFANDHKGYIPTASDTSWAQYADPQRYKFAYRNNTGPTGQALTSGGPVVVFDWASSLIPYLGGNIGDSFESATQIQSKVFRCPADQWLNVPAVTTAQADSTTQIFAGPGYTPYNNLTTSGYYPISYGINGDIACVVGSSNQGEFSAAGSQGSVIGVIGGPNTGSPPPYGSGANVGLPLQCKLGNVYLPSQTMLFADCGTRPLNWNGQQQNVLNRNDELLYTTNYNDIKYNTKTTLGDEGTLLGELSCAWLQLRIPTTRHNGVICVGFCDGHAEAVALAYYHKVRISPYNWQN
jgi:prepilin-type processing-associated H-X9-DG protein